jgi:hypothetical protein
MLLKYRCAACHKWESDPIGAAPYNCVLCGSTKIEPVPEKSQPLDHPANADAEKGEMRAAVAAAAEHIEATHPAENPAKTAPKAARAAGSNKE